jgi:uncharacterized protein (UPF0371 family)
MEIFPVLKRILDKICENNIDYSSPTDMGVNRAGYGICEDEVVKKAAREEVIRRYFRTACEHIMGLANKETVQRVELLMKDLGAKVEDRAVVIPAREAAEKAVKEGKGNNGIYCGAALKLKDGTIIKGKNSFLMHASSSLMLNAIKYLAGIPNNIHILSPVTIQSINNLKKEILKSKSISLDLEEALIALSMSATTNTTAQAAMQKLNDIRGCEGHLTHIPTPGDETGFRKLGVNLTSEPEFSSNSLFVS